MLSIEPTPTEKHNEPSADDNVFTGVSTGPLEFSICDDDSDDDTSIPEWGDFCEGCRVVDAKDFIKEGGHEVILHVYDVSHEDEIRRLNKVLAHKMSPLKFGGVFHAGVEVLGLEWSYGFTDVETQAGISCVEPKMHPQHHWRQSVSLGRSPLTPEEIAATLSQLVEDWPADEYELLRRNCCHFADDFCRRLNVKRIPKWVNRLARVGAQADRMEQGFHKAIMGLWRNDEPLDEEHAQVGYPAQTGYPASAA